MTLRKAARRGELAISNLKLSDSRTTQQNY